jgi:hypothetical protein
LPSPRSVDQQSHSNTLEVTDLASTLASTVDSLLCSPWFKLLSALRGGRRRRGLDGLGLSRYSGGRASAAYALNGLTALPVAKHRRIVAKIEEGKLRGQPLK